MRRRTKLSVLVLGALVGALLPSTGGTAESTDEPDVFRFNGGGYDRAAAITVDAAGNAYIGGSIDGDGEVTFAVLKLGPTGTVLWTAFYNGSQGGVDGSALAVTLDAAGNVYAAGWISDGAYYPNIDYLAVAFGPDGRQRWSHRYDDVAAGFDRATEIAVDSAGAVYVSGTSYTPSPSFTFDWSTQKYSPAGDLLWERRQPGGTAQADKVVGMAFGAGGNLVVSGTTDVDPDEYGTEIGTVTYDPSGNLLWQRHWSDGTTGSGRPEDMALDPAGRITITGTTGQVLGSSPVTLRYGSDGTLLQTIRGDGGSGVKVDGAGNVYLAGYVRDQPDSSFLARYDTSGTRTWATPLSLDSDETYISVHVGVDSIGAVTTAGTARNVYTHNDDYLVIRFSPDGRELWRYRFADPFDRDDRVAGLAIDTGDNVLVTGTSWNDYLSNRGGTADDIVTLRFAAGTVPPLLAPTDLSATGISRSQIRLAWRDNAGTEDGFQIERCQAIGCTDFAQIATVGHDVTTYTDQGLARNTKYSYRVRAFNAGGVSDYSNTATGKTRQR